jgi:cellulose biosynthesis protein BcsQ
MIKYAFWNNKGGTGKTSLAFQSIVRYAELHPESRILAFDLCPQANLSEMLLGGLHNGGSTRLLERQGLVPRCSIGGYFQLRLPSPYATPPFDPCDFITKPNQYNDVIPCNVDLVCGDPLLELQSNAINTLANNNIPGINAWIEVVDWIKDFVNETRTKYDVIFFDCNPSFSLYTQIGLSSTDRIILPVMADDSSRRAIQNAFSLIYGLKLPSDIYSAYMFDNKLKTAERTLPKIHLIVKNRLTQYMGPASAYTAVLKAIDQDVKQLLAQKPNLFTFEKIEEAFVEVRDFQTTGVVAFAKGQPFSCVRPGRQSINLHRVQIKADYLQLSMDAINNLVEKL